MAFLRVVEVFPPLYPFPAPRSRGVRYEAGLGRFYAEVKGIRDFADVFLVANVKNPALLKLDTVYAAIRLRESLEVRAGPAVVVRDQNRALFDSTVFTAIAAGLEWLFLAWGDDRPTSAKITNVRDFEGLASAIRRASLIRSKAHASTKFFAPVDVESLAYPQGVAMAKERLRAGADMLLAQPPTTDPEETFDRHASLVDDAGLKGRVLISVFPFRDRADIIHYQRLFGWRLSNRVLLEASRGERRMNDLAGAIVERLRTEGHPGVYLVTRGNPGIARAVLH